MKINGATLTEIISPSGYTGSLKGYNPSIGWHIGTDGTMFLPYLNNSNRRVLCKLQADTLVQYVNPADYSGTQTGLYDEGIEYNGDYYFRYKNSTVYGFDLMKFKDCSGATKTIGVTSCSAYTSPSGKYIWSTSGTYSDTIAGVKCDTIITVNLNVINGTMGVDTTDFDDLTVSPNTSCGSSTTILGNWNNVSDDDDDWNIKSGSTSSSQTGPSSDHTSGVGNYVYVEATSCYNKTVKLQSKCIDLSTYNTATLSFWYHMYGIDIKQLKVTVFESSNDSIVFNLSGDQGDQWLNKVVDLTKFAGKTISVVFEASIGNNYRGDIALDDISVTGTKIVTSADDVRANNVSVFPNPATDLLNVSSSKPIQSIVIRTLSGQVISSFQGGQNNLDVSSLRSGLYIVEIVIEGATVIKKNIIQ